jgi:hypothetical protein
MDLPSVGWIEVVVTLLEGMPTTHCRSALPLSWIATSCRVIPPWSSGNSSSKWVDDSRIRVRYIDDNGQVQDKASERKGFPPPPLNPEVMEPRSRW